MTRSPANDSRDRSRNVRQYIVQYHFPSTGTRRLWEFHTSDKQQAYSKARLYSERGWLVGFKRHNGVGVWENLKVPGGAS